MSSQTLGRTLVGFPIVAAFLLSVLIAYTERRAALRLPAPSFKPVGPNLQLLKPAKEEGVFARNHILHDAKKLFHGVAGSESVAVGPNGTLYMLDKFGNVLRAHPEKEGSLERVAHLGAGRPLGFHFDAHGNLIICNAGNGLQMLEKGSNKVILLAAEAPSNATGTKMTPIRYANDLAVAQDGSIYFSDSTEIPPALNPAGFYDTLKSFIYAMLQGNPTGRLLRYDPATKQTSFVAGTFFYANGVALAEDESYVLVVETCNVRVVRIWLKGEKAGTRDIFFQGTPGYPDGIIRARDGTFWLSIVTPKQPSLERAFRLRFLRWLLSQLPARMLKIRSGTAIVQLSAAGNVVRYIADADGSHVNTVSAVTETPKGLYLGNLGGQSVSFLSKTAFPQASAAQAGT